MTLKKMVSTVTPRNNFGYDAVETLFRLCGRCVPYARRIFVGSHTPLRLLHQNDYILEKAFVYGIMALSKWLGRDRLPPGVYGKWPPKLPAKLVPTGINIIQDGIVQPPPLPPPVDAPPHLRKREASSSSTTLSMKKRGSAA